MKGIYRYFNLEYDAKMGGKMKNWLAASRQHKNGVHRYSLEQFGLNENRIHDKFDDYIKRFNVHTE